MPDILSKGSLFPAELVPGFIQKTTGASALAKLCGATPIPFNGMKEFTFTLDKEVDIVAENGAKTKGGATVDSITILPLKVEYGARVSDEFLYASEEYQMNVLEAFADGFKEGGKGSGSDGPSRRQSAHRHGIFCHRRQSFRQKGHAGRDHCGQR